MALADASWNHEAVTEAQHALQLRYGFTTAAQTKKALQLAQQKMKTMYKRVLVDAN